MNLSRREFGQMAGSAGIAALTLSALELEGCNVWNDISAWVPVGIAAFESVVTLVAPLAAPGINAIAETVKAGFAALAAAVNQYINAPASSKTTFLAKVQLIFSQLSGDLQSFLNAVNISGANPIVKVVLGLVNIILSTIAGFMTQIGPTPPPATLRLAGTSVTVTPVKRNKNQFKAAFNAECVADGHPEAQIQ